MISATDPISDHAVLALKGREFSSAQHSKYLVDSGAEFRLENKAVLIESLGHYKRQTRKTIAAFSDTRNYNA